MRRSRAQAASSTTAIPHLLSRYNFEFVDEAGNVTAATPGEGPEGYIPKTKVLASGDDVDMKTENGTHH